MSKYSELFKDIEALTIKHQEHFKVIFRLKEVLEKAERLEKENQEFKEMLKEDKYWLGVLYKENKTLIDGVQGILNTFRIKKMFSDNEETYWKLNESLSTYNDRTVVYDDGYSRIYFDLNDYNKIKNLLKLDSINNQK